MTCEDCGRPIPTPKISVCDSCEAERMGAGYQLITLGNFSGVPVTVWYRDRTKQQVKDDAHYSAACQRGFLDV